MKIFIPAIAAAVLAAGVAQATPMVDDTRNAAEVNFGSTHPGTVTARSGLSTQDQVVLRTKGEVPGTYKENEQVTQQRNYNALSHDRMGRMDRMSGIEHRIPSK